MVLNHKKTEILFNCFSEHNLYQLNSVTNEFNSTPDLIFTNYNHLIVDSCENALLPSTVIILCLIFH